MGHNALTDWFHVQGLQCIVLLIVGNLVTWNVWELDPFLIVYICTGPFNALALTRWHTVVELAYNTGTIIHRFDIAVRWTKQFQVLLFQEMYHTVLHLHIALWTRANSTCSTNIWNSGSNDQLKKCMNCNETERKDCGSNQTGYC